MEVRIRMQKAGKSSSKRYNYRVVAIGRAKARQADHLDLLGHYDPSKKPAVFSIDKVKLEIVKVVAKLSNDDFLARAPDEVVAEHEERRETFEARLVKLTHARERMNDDGALFHTVGNRTRDDVAAALLFIFRGVGNPLFGDTGLVDDVGAFDTLSHVLCF